MKNVVQKFVKQNFDRIGSFDRTDNITNNKLILALSKYLRAIPMHTAVCL